MSREKAIQKLKENKEVCVKISAFGSDNLACLDAMINCLENGYDMDKMYEEYDFDDDLLQAALSTLEMEDNNFEDIEQYLYPVR